MGFIISNIVYVKNKEHYLHKNKIAAKYNSPQMTDVTWMNVSRKFSGAKITWEKKKHVTLLMSILRQQEKVVADLCLLTDRRSKVIHEGVMFVQNDGADRK